MPLLPIGVPLAGGSVRHLAKSILASVLALRSLFGRVVEVPLCVAFVVLVFRIHEAKNMIADRSIGFMRLPVIGIFGGSTGVDLPGQLIGMYCKFRVGWFVHLAMLFHVPRNRFKFLRNGCN